MGLLPFGANTLTDLSTYTVCLFSHTRLGEAALHDLHEAGVAREAIHVIGDLGAPAGQPGAEDHTTFDRIHLPAGLRALFMDTIRSGGVILAVDAELISPDEVDRIAREHDALRIEQTSALTGNPSHRRRKLSKAKRLYRLKRSRLASRARLQPCRQPFRRNAALAAGAAFCFRAEQETTIPCRSLPRHSTPPRAANNLSSPQPT